MPPPRAGGSGGLPTTLVAALCLLAFFAGRFLSLPGFPAAAGRGPRLAGGPARPADRKMLLEAGADARAAPALVRQPTLPQYASFEELVEASGMLADRPPLAPGASGHAFYTVQPMQLLSWYPRAYLLPKFVDAARCAEVVAAATARLAPSGLALKKGDTAEGTVNIRTSQGAFLGRGDAPALAWIEDKIAAVTGVPAGHGEAFNVLRYEDGQHYHSHYDTFDAEGYGAQASQRVATVLVYLSDVEAGGETTFLFEGKEGMKRLRGVDYKSCEGGLGVTPRAGDALLFWNVHPDGSLDKHALHGGCAVRAGVKWTATKWVRDKCHGAAGAGAVCLGPDAV